MTNTQLQLMKKAFQGNFRFTRFVSNPDLTIIGSAVFLTTTNREVPYKENGFYTLNGENRTCYQQQTFLFTKDSLIIKNNRGQTLHIFNLNNNNKAPLKDTHICKDDRYAVDINIESKDNFTISYHVQGPEKNYSMKTDYTRLVDDKL